MVRTHQHRFVEGVVMLICGVYWAVNKSDQRLCLPWGRAVTVLPRATLHGLGHGGSRDRTKARQGCAAEIGESGQRFCRLHPRVQLLSLAFDPVYLGDLTS